MFKQLKLIANPLCPPWWKILLFMKICPKPEVNQLNQINRLKSPWRSSSIVYSYQDVFVCQRPDTKLKNQAIKVEIKIIANLTEEDGVRKLTSISNHKNSYWYSYKYLKKQKWQLVLIFFLYLLQFWSKSEGKNKKSCLDLSV